MNFAIIGFGGLGKLHFRNVPEVAKRTGDIQLVAICDIDENAFKTETKTNLGGTDVGYDLSPYNLYSDVEELFERE